MSKPVYDQRYYKIKALLKNQAFQLDIQWLKDQFAKYGVPVPENGFDSYKDYLAWNERFWQIWSERDRSAEVKVLWHKYANPEDKKIYGVEKYDEYEREKSELVPPIYGSYLRDVAAKYDFDPKDKEFIGFLTYYIFLGRDEILSQSVVVNHRRNEKTSQMEMYVRIFPWTTKEDIVSNWGFIKKEQAWYRTGLDRNQEWKNFDRDYRIFELYNQAREMRAGGDKRPLEEISYSLYYAETRDDDMDIANIKKIVSLTKQKLSISIGEEISSDNS